jgi:hypothetical protein
LKRGGYRYVLVDREHVDAVTPMRWEELDPALGGLSEVGPAVTIRTGGVCHKNLKGISRTGHAYADGQGAGKSCFNPTR